MELIRDITTQLEEWKNSQSRKALIITGARQVGKTYLINSFAEKNFKNYIQLNLFDDPELRNLINSDASSEHVLLYLNSIYSEKMKEGALIFFDEIQECPNIMTLIKFLVLDGRYRYIMSGSLLGIELRNIRSLPVGYVDIIRMYPLSFKEFSRANGVGEETLKYLESCFNNRIAVAPPIHERMLGLFRIYLIVGGMPEAVSEYVESHNLGAVTSIHRSITGLYKMDIAKYDVKNRLALADVYDCIPAELNSQNKRFKFSSVKDGYKFSRNENAFLWLTDAGVALAVYAAHEPVYPLLQSKSRNMMKLFLGDVGMLISMYPENLMPRIIAKDDNINFGGLYENLVAQELAANGVCTYFYNSKKLGELDFVIEINGEVVPIEVKSGKDYRRHSALDNVLSVKEYNIRKAYILANSNIEVKDNKIYLPIYMTMFIRNIPVDTGFVVIPDISGLEK